MGFRIAPEKMPGESLLHVFFISVCDPGSKFAFADLNQLNFLSVIYFVWKCFEACYNYSFLPLLSPSASWECGVVDKSSWQLGGSNHFPPDVRVWEGTKREGNKGERRGFAPVPVPPQYMKSASPPSQRLPVSPPPHHSSETFPSPPRSWLCTHSLRASQVAAGAGCVYCSGNWSSLERVWPWPCWCLT